MLIFLCKNIELPSSERGIILKINADLPIQKCEQDLLGRDTFSKMVADVIVSYENEESLVVGILGSWGNGKSSTINMIVEKIEGNKEKQNYIVVRFSPWNYSSQNDLISLFFNELCASVLRQPIGEGEKIIRAIIKYLEVLDEVPVLNKYSKFINKIIKKTKSIPSLENTKGALTEALKNLKKKILVVIDDVDRLNDSQVKDIFQLVKQIGDLPNILYVLSMDKQRVVKALDHFQEGNGEEYLEKIIQLPFILPEISEDDLRSAFFKMMEDSIKSNFEDSISWDQDYIGKVYADCVSPYVRNLRDISRIMNVFLNKLSIFKDSICIEDLIALSALEVLEPNLYHWIYNYSGWLCINGQTSTLNYNQVRNSLNEVDVDIYRADQFLSVLFSKWADLSLKGSVNKELVRSVENISNLEKIFLFTPNRIGLERAFLNNYVFNFSENEMKENISKIVSEELIEKFIKEIGNGLSEINFDRKKKLIVSLLELSSEYKNKNNVKLNCEKIDKLRSCLRVLLGKVLIEERDDSIIDTIIGMRTAYDFGLFLSAFKDMNVSESQRVRIKSIIDQSDVDYYIGEFSNLKAVLPVLKQFSEEKFKEVLQFINKDDMLILKFMLLFARKIETSNGEVCWKFDEEAYSEYITMSAKDLKTLISSACSSKVLAFSKDSYTKLVALYIFMNDIEKKAVSEKQVHGIIDTFKVEDNLNTIKHEVSIYS